MSIPSHLVSAKIAEARARGVLERPSTDEARVLAELDRLLAELPRARDGEALRLRARLERQERRLADVLDRTGQSLLADVLWDTTPTFDAYC
ncbi:MAG TPA: hypothetical protein RMH99_23530 [Sandaracinaceae bacterium LLY-WYZ-13_1]|nr:hypothetical protein [Sandaracinaceae bacterium LLY-WYZ-13_1]